MPTIDGKTYSKEEFFKMRHIDMSEGEIVSNSGDSQKACIMSPAHDFSIYVSLERALEPMVVEVGGNQGMWENPMGPRTAREYDGGTIEGVLASIQGFFTAGLSHTGATILTPASPDNKPHTHIPLYPLHGMFSQTAPIRDSIKMKEDQENDDLFFRVNGIIPQNNMVLDYAINVDRTVEAKVGEYAFTVTDVLHAIRDSVFMLLYHPNFNIAEGDELFAPITKLYARDEAANVDIGNYAKMTDIGKRLPERCYIAVVQGSKGVTGLDDGTVIVAKVSADRKSGIYIEYNLNDFFPEQRNLHLWKNTQAGVLGLEPGSTFEGRNWAEEHHLTSELKEGEERTYRVKVGFMRNEAEVNDKLTLIQIMSGGIKPKIIEAGQPLEDAYIRRKAG